MHRISGPLLHRADIAGAAMSDFVTILPPNSTDLEQAVDETIATRIEGVPVKISDLVDVNHCPASHLPFLAWALSVDKWDSNWSETIKRQVIAEMLGIADRLRAIIVADGPNTNDQDAITYRNNFGSRRVYLVDPGVKVWDTDTDSEIIRPASTRAAGLIAKSDSDSGRGFWWSPSNQQIYGITGTARAIDFTLGDKNARANFLNENEVTTIIHEKGYRLWGNRTCSSDPKWAFLNVRRTADMINESILQAHLWAVDRNINRTYVDDVLEGLQEYLLLLRRKEAIINGTAWVDPAHNPSGQIMEGNVKFCFDFSANYPAERVTVQSMMVDDYLVEIFE